MTLLHSLRFSYISGKTYFLKGSRYWRYSEVGILDAGYPKDMSQGFAGIPTNVDAAVVWAKNSKIYFFKGSKYWKLDPDQSSPPGLSGAPSHASRNLRAVSER